MLDGNACRTAQDHDPQDLGILTTARSEGRGEGWMVVRALLLILGGIAIVSYVMMTIARAGG
ncbi:hypothetical protein [Roseococcus sp.]|uniref:hypothetical protein n=1 Tax=Roseococcus sp. TaxID=2109646 RepID=UPI003BA85B08